MLNRDELSDALGRLSEDMVTEADCARRSGVAEPIFRPRRLGRTAVALGLAAALLTAGVLGAVTTYSRWHMPEEGETYRGGVVETTQVTHYPMPGESLDPEGEEPFSDGWFLARAAAVLEAVNKEETQAAQLTLTRQINQSWDREEVEVTFADGGHGDVTFDARSGYLIHVTAFDREVPEGGTPMAEADALAIAQGYYDALPYARGYVFDYVEKYDDHAWSFHFDRPMEVELWGEKLTLTSDYEQVRIMLDPCTGAFQLSNCFYVPLLDDHAPEDVPLTRAEALAVTVEADPSLKDYEVLSAAVAVCLPRPGGLFPSAVGEMAKEQGTEDGTEMAGTVEPDEMENPRHYTLTRLGWSLVLEYQSPDSPFASRVHVCVDLYTGELLSWDIAK